ncbi:MAG TPA: response regulator [Planctomycetota bacterium]
MKILVADDDKVVLKLVCRLLEREGHTVIPVGDGVSACAAAESAKPDLAIVDLLLPKRDGFAVLMRLRSQAETRDLPLFLLTSELRAENEGTALALGANGLLSKPVKPEDILEAIRRVSDAPVGGPR